jgi:hypothetical protein
MMNNLSSKSKDLKLLIMDSLHSGDKQHCKTILLSSMPLKDQDSNPELTWSRAAFL